MCKKWVDNLICNYRMLNVTMLEDDDDTNLNDPSECLLSEITYITLSTSSKSQMNNFHIYLTKCL